MTAPIAQHRANGLVLCDVIVRKPGQEPLILGPTYKHNADHWAADLRMQMVGTAHPAGTVIDIAPHTEACDHPEFAVSREAGVIASLIVEEDYEGEADRFPDLWARLHMALGYTEASGLWGHACLLLAGAEDDEAQ